MASTRAEMWGQGAILGTLIGGGAVCHWWWGTAGALLYTIGWFLAGVALVYLGDLLVWARLARRQGWVQDHQDQLTDPAIVRALADSAISLRPEGGRVTPQDVRARGAAYGLHITAEEAERALTERLRIRGWSR